MIGTSFRTARKLARTAGLALRLQWEATGYWTVAPLAVTVLAGCLPALGAIAMRSLIDRLAASGHHHGSGRQFALLVAGLAAVAIATQLMSQVSNVFAAATKYRVAVGAARRLYGRVMTFSGLRYFEDPVFRDGLLLAEQAAQTAPGTLSNSLQQILQAAVVLATFVGALFWIWPPIIFVLFVLTVPSILAQTARAKTYAEVSQAVTPLNRMGLVYRALLVDIAAAKEARLFGFGQLLVDRYAEALDESGRRHLRLDRKNAMVQGGLTVVTSLCVAVGLWVVVNRAASGALAVGDVTFFIAATSAVQGSLNGIAARVADLSLMLHLLPHFGAIVDAPDDLGHGTQAVRPLHQEIVFDDVWFRYGPDNHWVLKELNLRIPRGTSLGVVGLNGAGKSTLVKLLCRFYDPDRGTITWDGVDIREFDPRDLRERIGAIFQDYVVYELTAAENIGLGAVDHIDDHSMIESAAASANIASVLEGLPRGYETLLSRMFLGVDSEAGVRLSGGEGQRLAFARALMRTDTDVLILDEPNAGLDPAAEHAMRVSASKWAIDRTTILVSHRLGAIRGADAIVVLENGRVTESGTHDQLMSSGGVYARLFSYQADAYRDDVPRMDGVTA